MPKHQTSTRSSIKERTGIDRLYKRVGKLKVSWYYQHPDNTSETLASAPLGDRKAIADAERSATRKALDIPQGVGVAGSVAEMIERFRDEVAPTHYRDQSKDGLAVRTGTYANLVKFFGAMRPMGLKTLHGYQFLEARAKAGAPAKANKELSLMSTICHYAVRWGLIEANPFTDMMQNRIEKKVRTIYRGQVVRFYLWSCRQTPGYQVMGCAGMFTYLTGFRAAEVRPFHIAGLGKDGVRVVSAKRKMGEDEVTKLRDWSPRLRTVVARAKEAHTASRMYLFANAKGQPYTKSGWGVAVGGRDVRLDRIFRQRGGGRAGGETGMGGPLPGSAQVRRSDGAVRGIQDHRAPGVLLPVRCAAGGDYYEAAEPERGRLRLRRARESGDHAPALRPAHGATCQGHGMNSLGTTTEFVICEPFRCVVLQILCA